MSISHEIFDFQYEHKTLSHMHPQMFDNMLNSHIKDGWSIRGECKVVSVGDGEVKYVAFMYRKVI